MVMMRASSIAEQGRIRNRDLGTQFPVGSTTLSLGVILGIAVGGALLLFTILVFIGIIHVKKKHRQKKQQFLEASEDENMDIDLKIALRSTTPHEISLGRRPSLNPFLPLPDIDGREEWIKQDGLQRPPLARTKSTSQRRFFRSSSVRDSWPLMSNKPLGFLPGQTTMILSPVAPPGYVVQEPKWAKRTSSILGRKNSQDSSKSISPTRDPYPMDVMPYRKIHRRSTSENQLSTILRSTSQRLKAAQRTSMTRTLSTLGRFPGLPPSERLPTPPRGKATESREELIDRDHVESVGSSIYDVYAQMPSPKKKHQRTSSKRSPIKPKSPAESVEPSLCVCGTLDVLAPAPFKPSSKSPSLPAQAMSTNQDSGGAKDISALIHQDSRTSLFVTTLQETANSNKILSPPHRISLSGDPFLLSVRSSKPIMPSRQIQGPRPMYFRKAIFGQEATPERPASFCSPLRDVSGNAQSLTRRELPEPPTTAELNPFQWLPQEAIETRATQTSPKRSSSRRKGHKRSNVIRMSNLSRPASTVDIVPEEPEEVSSLNFNVPKTSSLHSVEFTQDQSLSKSQATRRTNLRPPSVATFNPTLIIPALLSCSEKNSSTLESDTTSDFGYSPTLSVCNYYTEKDSGSEDEFFKYRVTTSLQPSPSVLKSRRHGRNYSADLALFPTYQSQQYLQERLLSFPPLPLDVLPAVTPPPTILTPRPTSRPLPNITSTMNSLRSSAATPAPPILTIPNHVTSPRSEPGKYARATLSPPRGESMLSTISMLRRMNSEVSTGSCNSVTNFDSPTILLDSESPITSTGTGLGLGLDISVIETTTSSTTKPLDFTTSIGEHNRSYGSQHYLSLGQHPPSSNPSSPRHRTQNKARQTRHTRPEIRDSHRIHKERHKRRTEELEGAGMINELERVDEGDSPASGTNAIVRGSGTGGLNISLRFPTLSREGSVGATPPRARSKARVSVSGLRLGGEGKVLKSTETDHEEKDNYVSVQGGKSGNEGHARWSDAMPKPTTHVTRRESKMEHPSPVTPPKLTISGLGPAGVRLMERDTGGGVGILAEGIEEGRNAGNGLRKGTRRPESFGLYDQEGFLKCSPERERVLAGRMAEERRERKGRERARSRVSGFVM
ncbi:hypothetical protein BKA65DRAFT_509486 [Rhexocercosporidium sp. MPI-PUGE-AT-0058]|nr:hypothetical protein BKA65DRAFT_509486 [Rhexocercosporidium sp. MPI-PUGE-AT-0058]